MAPDARSRAYSLTTMLLIICAAAAPPLCLAAAAAAAAVGHLCPGASADAAAALSPACLAWPRAFALNKQTVAPGGSRRLAGAGTGAAARPSRRLGAHPDARPSTAAADTGALGRGPPGWRLAAARSAPANCAYGTPAPGPAGAGRFSQVPPKTY
jgi:hypothetical protein